MTVAPADTARAAPASQAGLAASRRLQALWWRKPPSSASDALARGLLWPLETLYGIARAAVALPWRLGWLRPQALPVPVVVVGNLIVGGAGKTPVVIALVEALRDRGVKLVRAAVGDKYVLEEMIRLGAPIGGEQSGQRHSGTVE